MLDTYRLSGLRRMVCTGSCREENPFDDQLEPFSISVDANALDFPFNRELRP